MSLKKSYDYKVFYIDNQGVFVFSGDRKITTFLVCIIKTLIFEKNWIIKPIHAPVAQVDRAPDS